MRNRLVRITFTCLVLIALCGIASAAAPYVPAENNRAVLSFDQNWKFNRQDVMGAEKPEFNDAAWEDVGLPHTYNDQDTFNKPPGQRYGDGGWAGKTWYRKHFELDSRYSAQQVFLEFEAARTLAKVWLNGQYLGEHISGFSSFAFDVTSVVKFGQTNALAVMVDDTEGENICAGNSSHWQPVLGGLYRHVRLHLTDKLHVSLPFYSNLGTEGTYAATSTVSERQADFRMTTEVQNHSPQPQPCDLLTEIVDAEGGVVLSLTATQTVPANGLLKFDQSGVIPNPHLWSLTTPYLYTVYTTLRSEGRVTDVYTTPLGVRTIAFDHQASRFLLNGQAVILRGWGQKPENSWPGLGSALPDWLLENDMKMMKEAGGNIVRWGHCAGPVAELNEGDRIGFLNWQPNISGESDYRGAIWQHKLDVMRDIIIRDRNHPSIVFWEGNNIDVSREHTAQLMSVVRKWDWLAPRPCSNRGPYGPATAQMQDFYIDMDGGHHLKDKAGVEGEYYRPEAPRRCWDRDSFPFVDCLMPYWRTQQDAMREFTAGWKNIAARGGGVKWHLTDDTTHCRLGTYAMARLSGTLDATRLPKDMHYAMKALFSDTPQIHIMGHWNYTNAHAVDVYANCEEVELVLNGKSLGSKGVKDWRATWDDVRFEPGTLTAVGKSRGAAVCSDERRKAGEPARISLEVMTNPKGMRADRADIALVTATITDNDGVPHPTAHNDITFAVSGPANYCGGYNDTIPNTTGKSTLMAEAGKIRVSLRATEQPGKVTVTATSPGLKPGKVEFSIMGCEEGQSARN